MISLEVKTNVRPDGQWKIELPQFPVGGPYILTIEGLTDKIEFKNVLIGDVWFASGQSNMEHSLKDWEFIPHSAVNNSEKEIADSNYPEIRLFSVTKFPFPFVLNYLQREKWEVASPESAEKNQSVG